MARRTLNRKELRMQVEAAEASGVRDTPRTKKTGAQEYAKSATRRKAYWGVFNHKLKQVALFEYSEREQADKKAAELSTKTNSPHVVQLVKEPWEG